MIEWKTKEHWGICLEHWESCTRLAYGKSGHPRSKPYVYICAIYNHPEEIGGPDRYRFFDGDYEMLEPTHLAYINEPWDGED